MTAFIDPLLPPYKPSGLDSCPVSNCASCVRGDVTKCATCMANFTIQADYACDYSECCPSHDSVSTARCRRPQCHPGPCMLRLRPRSGLSSS